MFLKYFGSKELKSFRIFYRSFFFFLALIDYPLLFLMFVNWFNLNQKKIFFENDFDFRKISKKIISFLFYSSKSKLFQNLLTGNIYMFVLSTDVISLLKDLLTVLTGQRQVSFHFIYDNFYLYRAKSLKNFFKSEDKDKIPLFENVFSNNFFFSSLKFF